MYIDECTSASYERKNFSLFASSFHRCFGGTGGESFGFAIVDVRGGRAGV